MSFCPCREEVMFLVYIFEVILNIVGERPPVFKV